MSQENFTKVNPLFHLMDTYGHNPAELSSAFPKMLVEQITQMLMDNRFGLRRTVERFGYLGIRECRSEYFNIEIDGCRSNGFDSSVNVDAFQVHLYGGSTTVGQNVADDQTISANLESLLRRKLNVNVFNYGAGNHTSLHSSLRLLDHVLLGMRPDFAIFLNGFNDCIYSTGGADGIVPFLDCVLEKSQDSTEMEIQLSKIVGLIPSRVSETYSDNSFDGYSDQTSNNNLNARYLSAVAIQDFVATYFGVKILRFIEPTIFISCRNDQRLLQRIALGNSRLEIVKKHYERIHTLGCSEVFGTKKLISLVSKGQEILDFPLYVDECHFSPAFNEFLANQMMGHLKFSREPLSHKSKKLSREIKGDLSEVANPNNYPLF